jgi:hypothetical protein
MGLLDIFNNDAFSMVNLTLAIDKLPYVPARVTELGIFTEVPHDVNIAVLEMREGKISLLPTAQRGQQGQATQSNIPRKLYTVPIPHVPGWDAILAESLIGRRAFGSEGQLEAWSTEVNDRLTRMKQNHELTKEYHRIGALKGIVYEPDGTTEIANMFTVFGQSQYEIEIDFADAGTYDAANPSAYFKSIGQGVKRHIQNKLGQSRFTGIRALCGDEFFDAFINHSTVRRAYDRYLDTNQFSRTLQSGPGGFEFCEVIWENYRGFVGNAPFIASDECIFYPEGTQDVFIEAVGPGDFIECVGTKGKPLYVKQELMKYEKGVELHSQSNVLPLCTRPSVLVKGRAKADSIPSGTTVAPTLVT